ncbi:cytochrome c oxidase subunit CcoM [Marinobacter sp. NP-4(2019)]|uniref:cytochrome c oxidase subunit CcoM n=1 Tax=Marinobacter sp. NP-4(2019) TaxID=2488665 RepID=UPI0013DFBCA2|nr:cytochrome c oxidase subunit CcoM [Marinobacter sp. NP-4(2019)]
MYMDAVVIAGILTVLLILAFFVGVGIFVMKDARRSREKSAKVGAHQSGKTV